MAPLPLPLQIKITPQTLALTSVRPFSSYPFPDQSPNSNGENNENRPSPKSSHASLFSDIKERLRSPPSPPRRIPNDPPPPPIAAPTPIPATSTDEVRRHLSQFRFGASPFPNPSPSPNPNPPSQGSPMSFQELFRNRKNPQDPNSRPEGGGRFSLFSIRDSLRQSRPSLLDAPRMGLKPTAPAGTSLIGDRESLPESIFGREMREKKGEKVREGEGEVNKLRTEFRKLYSPEELGEKLRMLRPEKADKGGKDWFSLEELNLRLAKLRELEDKEAESGRGIVGPNFSDLRGSLMKIKDADNTRKASSMQRLSILSNISLHPTPSFMHMPPQEQLLENYFHPDHMSSAEKMKLELKKVRDDFKMSESDCGSSRVQIAQLTTKIKHLSSVLHKKDKHSRKGLNEMVQRRKKLLKYLRGTDWESYCFVLSKLGLRDVPEYKVPDYKS